MHLQIKVESTTYLLKVPNFQELRRSTPRIRETFLKCVYKVMANGTHADTLNQMRFASKDRDNIWRGQCAINASWHANPDQLYRDYRYCDTANAAHFNSAGKHSANRFVRRTSSKHGPLNSKQNFISGGVSIDPENIR